MVTLLLIIFATSVVLFAGVWSWAMWIAFTRGDDVVARFGRKVLRMKQTS